VAAIGAPGTIEVSLEGKFTGAVGFIGCSKDAEVQRGFFVGSLA